MNSDQLAARIYATEVKPFIPGYDRKSLLMGKYVNFSQLKAKHQQIYPKPSTSYLKECKMWCAQMGKDPPNFISTKCCSAESCWLVFSPWRT